MDRVEPQAIEVVISQPHQRVIAEKAPHLVAIRAIKVDRITPRRLMPLRKIRAEQRQIVAARTEVVVNDIQDDPQSTRVARVDQPLQALRSAIRLVRRIQGDSVITPAAIAQERSYRQQLDMRNPQVE